MTDAPHPDETEPQPAAPPDAGQSPPDPVSEPRRLADPTFAIVDDDERAADDNDAAPDVEAEAAAADRSSVEASSAEGGSVEASSVDTADDDEALAAAAERVAVDLELLRAERDEFLEAYRRAQADFENYRKQAYRRQEDAVQRALGGLVDSLLPVLDACDAAVAHGAGEAVEPVVSALYGALEKEGLERINPVGEPFDPTEAEAVIHEPGEGGEQVVAEVMRAGYRWRGQVLRPAMVKVTD